MMIPGGSSLPDHVNRAPGSAPFVELKLARSVHGEQRVRTAILVLILVVQLAIGAYLVPIARKNQQSLTILKCAIAHSTSVDAHGHRRSDAAIRAAFDRCVNG